ncbi:50S ribosome-binding GTPase [Candidatus Micrarchaeota archaeon]|nr:50S ribosome-binding GTPase [Candidatus Micrarchaeota archaeon]MBU1930274.1 50S ribosome-binding GTPase [Candidatus Micrarchaeota archaeon]
MPANVSFEFERARIKYEQANSPQAKLEALQEMARYAPKHKGGENLRAEISRKIAKAKKEIEKAAEQAAKRGGGASLSVKKEGAGQIVLMGLPNSGKSTVLKALTGVRVEIADYPFTTTKPQVGMMDFFGSRIQIVELPAIVEGSASGKALGTQLLAIARSADAVLLVVNHETAVHETKILLEECKKTNIRLNETKPKIKIQTGSYKGLSVSGKKFLKFPLSELESFLKTQGIHNAAVILEESIKSLQQVQDALDNRLVFKKAMVLENFRGKPIQKTTVPAIFTISFSIPSQLEAHKKDFFALLDKVLVYTKRPSMKADLTEPLVLSNKSTVADLARLVHKEVAQKIRHAKLYGKNAKFKGQKVPRNYKLKNFDIIEIGL